MRYADLREDLQALKGIGAHPEGGWHRPAYSPVDCEAHDWAANRLREAGLTTRYDGAGNLIGRLEPESGSHSAAIAIGSHLDTVHQGGWLDGALGVCAGIAIARRMAERTDILRRPLEVIAFRDEEGRFGPFIGSRAMTGQLPADLLPRLRDPQGTALLDCLPACGLDPEGFLTAARQPGELAAYLELHVEQGPVLETAGVPVGLATAIAGQARMSVRFEGRPDHAGTTPMTLRADAFAAAASFACAFRRLIETEGDGVAVGTIGIVRVEPNVGNVVPARARLGLEIRDIDKERLKRLAGEVPGLAAEAARGGVSASVRITHEVAPTPLDNALRGCLAAVADSLAVPVLDLPSGAGHDVQPMTALCPGALVFVPSIGGRSHCPEEDTAWSDIEAGMAVFEAAVRELVTEK